MDAKGYIIANWPLFDQFVAGVAAGGTATILLHPLDLLKTRFQATTSSQFRALFSVPRELGAIYRAGRLPGLYRGFSANLAGSTTSWGVYFLLYRWLQTSLWNKQEGGNLTGWQYFLSSASAGMLTVLVANPLWMAKTRLCQPPPASLQYRGLFDCLSKAYAMEGFQGLYRGLLPGLFGTSHGAIQFLTYEKLKQYQSLRSACSKPSVTEYLAMSSLSKIVASLLTYPYQVVRCRLQLAPTTDSSPNHANSIVALMRNMWKHEGLFGFYKGAIPSTLRVLPGTCITFLVYEKLSSFFVIRASKH